MNPEARKTYLFYIGHPAHYHYAKNISHQLRENGNHIHWVVRNKDVLFQLVDGESFDITFLSKTKQPGKLGMAAYLLYREKEILNVARKIKPDLLLGTDPVITHVGKLLRIPSILFNEDDLNQVPLMAKYGVRFCSVSLAPGVCRYGKWEKKKIAYNGYQELTYLHPKYFTPNRKQVAELLGDVEQYFLLRFSALDAHHDENKKGITDELAKKMIEILEPRGKVFITSERELNPELEPYRIQLHPNAMHDVINYASLYCGDSQTMAAEAAMLGTPSIRFNDFVGKLSYLDELESVYKLTLGVPTSEPKVLLDQIEHMSTSVSVKKNLEKNRIKMLNDKIDVNAFWIWFLEQFPQSEKLIREHPERMDEFKIAQIPELDIVDYSV